MFFDILAVFVVTLISSLFLCTTTTSVHGLSSLPTTRHVIENSPAADLSSSLRLVNHRPVASVDSDSGGDISEMFIGDSNEDDDSFISSPDLSNERSEFDFQPSAKLLSRKLLQSQKRSSPTARFNSIALADSSNVENVANMNQFKEPLRLSPSLRRLVETNPFARAWLTMLLQKLMKEQSVPYVFKYGRRRK